jgi:amino acid adenylation domain-containing protein
MTNLISGFLGQSSTQPNHIALIQGQKQLSYKDLATNAAAIANFLSKQAEGNQRIVILLERGIDAATAILACLHSGFCYIPLDINNPAQRLNFIIEDADVLFVIGQGNKPDWLNGHHTWLDLDSVKATNDTVAPEKQISPESLAAILYTSGSTGQPKGVALSHRAIRNFTQWAGETFQIKANDNIASLSPFYFDLSTFDLFTSLSQGATVNFIPQKLTLSPSKLTEWLSDNNITTWYTVPSLLSFIALKGSLEITHLPKLKTIMFAGEVFSTPQLIKLTQLLPEVNFYNLYGPTETNVCCYWPVNKQQLDNNIPIPIGIPACSSTLKITPATGELQVKSKNNLSGYWQKGQLTSIIEEYYSTGDKVSINSNSEYCYHGRLDRMLKCSGFRVESAEIERVINNHSGVEQCVIIGITDPTSGQRPVAAIILSQGAELSEVNLFIRQRLPAYMRPCKYIQMETIPCLANGKIDYQAIEKAFITDL